MGEVVVIGGGIAGLACAFEISRRFPERPLLLLEATDRLGGNIRTSHEEGFTLEWGVNGFLNSVPETLDLVERIGLNDSLLPARDAAARRFIYRAGRLREIPLKPPRFLASDLLTLRGRLRVLGEPFARRRPDGDETVFDFAARRIGREAAEILVDSMASGVYAGDSRRLSLISTFPKMAEMERDYGSLFRALIAKKREARRSGEVGGGPAGPAGVLTSFRDGMESLVTRLVEKIGRDRIRTCTSVRAIERSGSGYRIMSEGQGTLDAERLIVAAPARHASAFLQALDPPLAGELGEIAYAGLAVVALAYRSEDLPAVPNGFGFLVPRGQGLRILGCLWDSSVFENRAAVGWTLLRAMIGGAQDLQAVDLDDATLVDHVRRDLRASMGIEAAPRLMRIYRHPLGIPQYGIGHAERLERIARRLAYLPGVDLVGNSYRGVAVNNCVSEAAGLACMDRGS